MPLKESIIWTDAKDRELLLCFVNTKSAYNKGKLNPIMLHKIKANARHLSSDFDRLRKNSCSSLLEALVDARLKYLTMDRTKIASEPMQQTQYTSTGAKGRSPTRKRFFVRCTSALAALDETGTLLDNTGKFHVGQHQNQAVCKIVHFLRTAAAESWLLVEASHAVRIVAMAESLACILGVDINTLFVDSGCCLAVDNRHSFTRMHHINFHLHALRYDPALAYSDGVGPLMDRIVGGSENASRLDILADDTAGSSSTMICDVWEDGPVQEDVVDPQPV